MTYSIQDKNYEEDPNGKASAFFIGQRGKWHVYNTRGTSIIDPALIGNKCDSVVSKIIAFVCSFFSYGCIFEVDLPGDAKGTFWVDHEVDPRIRFANDTQISFLGFKMTLIAPDLRYNFD